MFYTDVFFLDGRDKGRTTGDICSPRSPMGTLLSYVRTPWIFFDTSCLHRGHWLQGRQTYRSRQLNSARVKRIFAELDTEIHVNTLDLSSYTAYADVATFVATCALDRRVCDSTVEDHRKIFWVPDDYLTSPIQRLRLWSNTCLMTPV